MLRPQNRPEQQSARPFTLVPTRTRRFLFLPLVLIVCTLMGLLPLNHVLAHAAVSITVNRPALATTTTPTPQSKHVPTQNSKHTPTINPQALQQIRQKLRAQIHVTPHKKAATATAVTASAGAQRAAGMLPAYNNVGTSDDSAPSSGNFDGGNESYSAQALQSVGIVPGQTVTYDGISFVWPASASGTANNYYANGTGQVIPVTPVSGAVSLGFLGAANSGPSTGTATLTYTDASTQTFSLGMTDWTAGTPSYGNVAVATMTYRNTPMGKQTITASVFYAHVNLAIGKTLQSVTLPTTVNQGGLHIFAVGTGTYNNVGISDDTITSAANFDSLGNSYSAQELQDPNGANWQPGSDLNYNGMDLIWPNVAAGLPDNYQAEGQTIPVAPVANANTIGFIGAATNGNVSGTATLNYSDGTTQTFTLGFSDWTLNGFTADPTFSNRLFASLSHENTLNKGQQNTNLLIFYAEQTLQAGKTLQSITLPTTTTPGQLHLFTMGTRAGNAYPNNVGTSDDASTIFASFDGNGNSYSIEALKAAGIYPGQNASFNGVSFAWPDSVSVVADNYQANGQTIAVTPVANANTLAFLGSSVNGTTSGTATITFTDASTQTITLGFADWCAPSGALYGNSEVVARQTYLNTLVGQANTPNNLYYSDFSVPSNKTVQSVTLPSTVTGGQLHIFAIGTRAGLAYNNVGVSDDSQPAYGHFDGLGNSYSNQALQNTGMSAGQPFVSNGVVFTWPNVSPALENDYVANGQTLPVSPIANANTLAFLGAADGGPSTGTATITYTDSSTQTFPLTMSDWTLNAGGSQPASGNSTAATLSYRNTPTGKQSVNTYLFYTDIALQSGKTIQSVTLPITVNQGYIHIFAVGTKASTLYNNSGMSDDLHPAPGNFDGGGDSYSAQALQSAGITAGQNVINNGVVFSWPAPTSGLANNYQASGQTIAVTPVANATRLAFLGAANNGPSTGTATITYTDASTQTFTLSLSDWNLNGGTSQPVTGNMIVAAMPYRNSPTGKQTGTTDIFYTDIALQAGKTLQSVTLPATANQGFLHIFAIGTLGASVYNNAGVSDDAHPTFTNFDGNGESYSAQALQSHGIVAGQNVTINGVTFTWPAISSGLFNNYQAAGQIIPVTPVTNANTLALLGSATNGAASGSATLTFTDSTTQTITLGFSDWQPSGALVANTQVVSTQSYLNLQTGKATNKNDLYETEFSLPGGKTLQSVTLPSSVTGGQLHVFAIGTRSGLAYNNAGVSDDSNPTFGSFDGNGNSYSTQALQSVGINAGKTLMNNGVTFTWPATAPGQFNNYQVAGQVVPVTPVANATRLAFLGSAVTGPSTGTITVTYTDSSTQTFSITFSDWVLGAGTGQPVPPVSSDSIAATLSYHNGTTGKQTGNTYLFYTDVPLTAGKTLRSVTLPSTVSQGSMHIFAIGTLGTSVYNNTGVSDDAYPTFANFDGNGNSYSAQALQANGIVGGQTVSYNGVTFTWPGAATGQFNNYQAAGQIIPVTPVSNATTLAFLGAAANGSSSGTATLTFSDASTQTVTLGFSDWSTSGALASNTVLVATQAYRNTSGGRGPVATYLYYSEFSLPSGKTLQSVTLPTTVTGGQLHVFALGTTVRAPYNNAGVSDDGQPASGNFDGGNTSYSAQALQSVGIVPGQNVSNNGVTFSWPNAASGSVNNYQTAGQIIPVTPVTNATRLAFLGSANAGPSTGTITVTYTDSTTQTFPITFSDWILGAGLGQPVPPVSSDSIAATMTYHNGPTGKQTNNTYVFYTDVALTAGKTLQSVTLPATVNQGAMHIFAIGTRANSPYNNVGVSDDVHPSFANFDQTNDGYSAQALQSNGISAGKNVSYNGVTFTWPNALSGQFNNYQAAGQVIAVTPVSNANTLAFLGSATNGTASGSATITYTDASTQTITLSFADWQLPGTLPANNLVAATQAYVNTPTGRANNRNYLYYSEFVLTAGKTIQSITLPTTVTGGQLHVFAVGTRAGVSYNNIGVSDDTQPTSGNLDGGGNSYSAQALRSMGIAPGKTLMNTGVSFTWPNAPVGQFNNYQANGQTISVTPVVSASTLAFLGAGTNGSASGVATITYTDASTSTFTLGLSNWWNSSQSTLLFGNNLVTTAPYLNGPTGRQTITSSIYEAETPLQAGKTIQSITLPTTITGGQMHIFAIGTRAASVYNNVGTSDDAHPTFANYDGGGASYSTTALLKKKVTAGGTVLYNGVSFIWPNVSGGSLNNYQANGQTITVAPVANATTLAFLGAATAAGLAPSASGTVIITYTDNSTQTFTLLLNDWTLNAGQGQLAPGNKIAVAMPYRNTATGKQSINTYVFYTDVVLQTGKTLQSVTLPTGVPLHIFSISTK